MALKVRNAPTADAAIADIAGVSATEVLRAGSRLERGEGIEKLISEHSSTDLAALAKVSDKLPRADARVTPHERTDGGVHPACRPLAFRRTSDMLSQYVGETGPHMTAMRKEAEAEKAVLLLLLYGADRFLQGHPAACAHVDCSSARRQPW